MPDAARDETSNIWRAVAEAAPYLLQNDLGQPSVVEFEHEAGWDLIVLNLSIAINQNVRNRLQNDPDAFDLEELYFTQVKEKYGKLQVYLSVYDPVLNALVDFAGLMSSTTCEVSGRAGKLHSKDGFLKTLHPKVAADQGFLAVT